MNTAMPPWLVITHRGCALDLPPPAPPTTLGQLAAMLEAATGLDSATMKLHVRAKPPRCVPLADRAAENARDVLTDAGKLGAVRAMLTGSSAAEVRAVNSARDASTTLMDFDAERRRAARRAGVAPGTAASAPGALPTRHTFRDFRVLDYADGVVNPPPSEAMKLLRQIAADPGVRSVMANHRYSVGTLSEMHPEGRVGVSEVCVLGYNVNQGQEISLRLRTDDLRGFRRLRDIKLTLMHELAHNEFREHDQSFKELNSRLVRELESLDWRTGRGRTTGGGRGEGDGWLHLPGDDAPPTVAVHTTGGDSAAARSLGPAAAAAAAAVRREQNEKRKQQHGGDGAE